MKRLIRLPEVIKTTGLCRSEVYRLEGEGRFPVRVPLGERTTAWDADEIQEWVRARIAEREMLVKQRAEIGQRLAKARSQPAASLVMDKPGPTGSAQLRRERSSATARSRRRV